MKILKNMKCLGALITGIVLSASIYADTYPKDTRIDVINYIFEIEVFDDRDEIESVATIDLRFLAEGVKEFRLDLVKKSRKLDGKGMLVSGISSNGKPVEFRHIDDSLFIVLPKPSNKNQREQFRINYAGIPATGLKIANNKYGERTFFSDNWADKGRNWLPTVDHPYEKATCEFRVTAPNKYQVVSNGLKIEETDLSGNRRLTHWKQTVPIASWLYVLGAARFAVQNVDNFEGKSIQTWVYHQDRDAGFYDFGYITKDALAFYSDRIGPFEYEKLANIQSNSVSGGMEAASAILYSENSVSGNRSIRWRNVVIHEIAHQWFGNSVTENDWDEVWISEGFATYFTLLFIEYKYGRDAFLDGLKSSKVSVDNFYQKRPDYRIIHDNLKDMKDVTTSQIYQKGSWVLHMLRGVIGTDNFWKGIRIYYSRYRNSHATVDDFRRVMEEVSGKDLARFFDQWLYKPGTLKLKGDWKFESDKQEIEIKLNQVQEDDSNFQMPIELRINYPKQTRARIEKLVVDSKKNVFRLKSDVAPNKLELDPNTWVLMDADFEEAR